MFCERCGFQIAEGQRFCSSCGKPIGISLVPLERQGKVQRNLQVLAILWLVAGALNLLIGFGLYMIGHVILGNIASNTNLNVNGFVTFAPVIRSFMAFVGVAILIKALLGLATGIGLLQRETWARPLAIVMSFFELLHMPFGTALGIYTLIVLLPGESAVEYEQMAKAA